MNEFWKNLPDFGKKIEDRKSGVKTLSGFRTLAELPPSRHKWKFGNICGHAVLVNPDYEPLVLTPEGKLTKFFEAFELRFGHEK